MDYFVGPIKNFQAEFDSPPSKYITHRALFIGSLMGATLVNYSNSDDCEASLDAIEEFGAKVVKSKAKLEIEPFDDINEDITIFSRDSGTTARFSMALGLLSKKKVEIHGGQSLSKRPFDDSALLIEELGGWIRFIDREGYLPLQLGGPITKYDLKVSDLKTTQLISGILMLAARMGRGVNIEFSKIPTSIGYIKSTLSILTKVGIKYCFQGQRLIFRGMEKGKTPILRIPGDFASSAFFMVAALITGSTITINNLSLDYYQPDSAIIDFLKVSGAEIKIDKNSIYVKYGYPREIRLDVSDSPDLFPILSILASKTEGNHELIGPNSLRFKESNRFLSTLNLLKSVGVKCDLDGNVLRIKGGRIKGGVVDSMGDHRIAMAAAIAGLGSEEGVLIKDFEVYRKSYPEFIDILRRISG